MKSSLIHNQQGQFVIEAILLMVVLVGLMTLVTTQVRESGLIAQMVTGPWDKIAGMTEFGVWSEPTDGNRRLHPNTHNRVFTPED